MTAHMVCLCVRADSFQGTHCLAVSDSFNGCAGAYKRGSQPLGQAWRRFVPCTRLLNLPTASSTHVRWSGKHKQTEDKDTPHEVQNKPQLSGHMLRSGLRKMKWQRLCCNPKSSASSSCSSSSSSSRICPTDSPITKPLARKNAKRSPAGKTGYACRAIAGCKWNPTFNMIRSIGAAPFLRIMLLRPSSACAACILASPGVCWHHLAASPRAPVI